ncbi:MAG: hypothetical protein MR954_00995 [Lachnobacterium sp.]|nr:hypothetical protein [Lachnobacterium sp.]MDD7713378.1 hypothetical protein [Lachnobacterium sp.]MDY5461307.1 hypothetical protein [Agathobacter sp.]
MDERNYLLQAIRRSRRKLNMAKTLDTCTCFLACAGVAAIVLEAASIWIPFYYVHLCAGIALLVAFLAGLVYSIVKRVGMHEAARRIDTFGLQERVQTAYEQMEDESAFACMQRRDAAEKLRGKVEKKEIRIRLLPDKRHLTAAALSLGLACGLAFIPSQARETASQRHAIHQEAKEKQKELSELADALEQMDTSTLTDEQKAKLSELQEALNRSMQELARADSREALDAAKNKLGFKLEQTSQSLANLASQMSKEQQAAIAQAQALAKSSGSNGTQSASNGGSNGTPGTGDGSSGDGNNGSNGNGSNGNNANGDGNGSDGDNNGNGSGNGSGDGSNGDGSNGNGSGNGKGNGNGNGNGSGNGSGRGTGQGGGTHDYVSVPNAVGNDENLTGNKTGDENGDSYRAQNGLVWEGDHVSLDSVIGDYTKDAYEGISSGRYPSGMEDVIKDYFKNLSE